MRYLVTLKSAPMDAPPPEALLDAILALGAEATASGALLDTAGLAPSAMGGARVALADGEITVTDGPFAESKEMVSYALYQVRDRAEAVEWAARFLRLHRDLWPEWQGEADVLRVFTAP
ncbi:YciI family protein [Actinocorallia aurea]